MGVKSRLRRSLQQIFPRYGYELVPSGLVYPWQRASYQEDARNYGEAPDAIREALSPNHPRLKELQIAYAAFGGPVTQAAVWAPGYVRPEDLLHFRGDNAYVWQIRERDMNEMSYSLAYYHTKSRDELGLLERLVEDGAFGAHVFEGPAGRLVSRDLLDSVSELGFLHRHLGLGRGHGTVMLDVGAGYGRLAYRTVTALESVARYLCTDAIAPSTFLCEYYLRFRNVEERTRVIPLNNIEDALDTQRVDIAVNIHSWSECRLEAIAWWVALLKRSRVRHIMVVPNRVTRDGNTMLTNSGEDFSRLLYDNSYQLIVREPKYADPLIQKYGVSPAFYFLFGLQS